VTNSQIEHSGVHMGRILIVDRVGRSRQDDALGVKWKPRDLLRAGEHLSVDIEFTKTPSDQVGVL